jgi:hypothetical protein
MPRDATPIRRKRKAEKRDSLPNRFTPRYLKDVDLRTSAMKEFKRRLQELQAAAGADSPQKKLLCERANFIASRLQSMELDALEGREIEEGVYAAMTNTLLGLLKTLKLEMQTLQVTQKRTLKQIREEG